MSWLLVVAAYCLGSVSFGLLIVGRLEGQDLRGIGSGNPGATNVLRAAGRGPALTVLALDILKGALPVAVGIGLGVGGSVLGATAVAAVAGHVFPVFHGFRGGKGVATAAGALGVLEPWLLLGAASVFAVVVAWTRFVSLASISGMIAYCLLAVVAVEGSWLVGDRFWVLPASAVIALLVVVRHHANIGRLIEGSERRLGEKRGSR